jgi:hypothetical protein
MRLRNRRLDSGEDIKAFRVASKTEETSRDSEIVRAYVLQCRAKIGESGIGRSGVARIGFYKKIEVFGKTRLRMKDDGVTAHDEVFNSMGMEGGQKVFVVLVHPVRFSNL